MNDVKLVSFAEKRVWPMRRTGTKISTLIETRWRWRQFLLAGKAAASFAEGPLLGAPGGYH
jgi:hypothetical protein